MEEEAPCGIQFIPLMRECRAGWRVTSWSLVVVLLGCGEVKEESTDALPFASELENNMVAIPGGTFWMGAGEDSLALPREFPAHPVTLSPFLMDAHEVTNRQFAAFVEATGYVTVAERPLDWEELKTQLPPGTPRPSDVDLAPGSLVFSPPANPVGLEDASAWWSWVQGADWRHPFGPDSGLGGMEGHPVVHVCHADAVAYAEWCGKRLPTEAEWEWAARGGLKGLPFPWGREPVTEGPAKCNIWSGRFPVDNTLSDGHYGTAPVGQYSPNGYGLFDMAGNVWEVCSDWYDPAHYARCDAERPIRNPLGPETWSDPMDPLEPKRVMRGGSFLCNDSYCSSYRVTARMAHGQSTGMSHVGLRCVLGTRDSP